VLIVFFDIKGVRMTERGVPRRQTVDQRYLLSTSLDNTRRTSEKKAALDVASRQCAGSR